MCNTMLHEAKGTKVKEDQVLAVEGDSQLGREDTYSQLEQCRTGMWSERIVVASGTVTASWWPWENSLPSLGFCFSPL